MEQEPKWERQLIEKLAGAALLEQKRTRQWKTFFRLAWLLLIGTLLAMFFWQDEKDSGTLGGKHTAVISLEGVIDSENNASGRLLEGLEHAYNDRNTKGIIIRANSPGGSPVLSGIANDEIRRLKKLHPAIPLHVVVEEVCASGCYYIAAAADKIHVDKASIIGSIGVVSDGFGFDKAIEKLGIERRLTTAGSNKAMNDPFSPRNPQQQAIHQSLLDEIHQQFIAVVKQGRGSRLKTDADIFSGRVWLGSSSIALGLADDLGSVGSVAREQIQAEELVDFTPSDDFGNFFAKRIGVSFAGGIRSLLDTRFF